MIFDNLFTNFVFSILFISNGGRQIKVIDILSISETQSGLSY